MRVLLTTAAASSTAFAASQGRHGRSQIHRRSQIDIRGIASGRKRATGCWPVSAAPTSSFLLQAVVLRFVGTIHDGQERGFTDESLVPVLLLLALRLHSCSDQTKVEGPFPLAFVDVDGSTMLLPSFDLVSAEGVRLKVFVKGAHADELLAAITARCAPQVRKVIERGVAHGSSSLRGRSSCASSRTAPPCAASPTGGSGDVAPCCDCSSSATHASPLPRTLRRGGAGQCPRGCCCCKRKRCAAAPP